MVGIAVGVDAGEFEAGFGEEAGDGEVVGFGFGHDRAELGVAGILDELKNEGGADALAAEVVVDAEVLQDQGVVGGVGLGEEYADDGGVMLGDVGDAFVGAGGELFGEEAEVVREAGGLDELFAEGAFFKAPLGGDGLAGAFEVEVLGRFDGGVDFVELGQIGGGEGTDLHWISIDG